MKKGVKIACASTLLTVALIGGAFLRFENLGRQSYWMDEGYTVNAVISGMQNGTDHLASILDSGSRYFCPIYCIPTQGIVSVLGSNPISFRLLAAICGVLVILGLFHANSFQRSTHCHRCDDSHRVFLLADRLVARSTVVHHAGIIFLGGSFFLLSLPQIFPRPFLESNPPPAPPLSGRGAC